MILAQGIEALHRLAIALLEKNQSHILSMELDTLLHFLKNDVLETYKVYYEKERNEGCTTNTYSLSLTKGRH